MKESGPEQVLEVQTGLKGFIARLRIKEKPAAHWQVGSRLKLTGVFVGQGGSRMEQSDVNSFELLLNSPSDVVVVALPPWWTLPRLLAAVAVLAVGLMLTFLWITVLRRQVERRTIQLQREIGGRERAEKERAIEQERARIARDLHDDMGSNVTEINMLAMTALEMKIKPEERGEFLQLIADKSGSMVTVLDELVWAVNPKNDTLASLAEYLASFAEEYFSRTQINCQVEIPLAFPNRTVAAEARHHVVLAVREVFNNAVRHGKPSEVSLRMALAAEQFEILIQDNGVGFDLKRHSQGNGLANLQERMRELKGQCRIESQPGQGTCVAFCLPL
ncbi:MAG: ATP-binding protein [Verrucomicrobiota bacterium]